MSYLPLVSVTVDLLKTMAWCIESDALTLLFNSYGSYKEKN